MTDTPPKILQQLEPSDYTLRILRQKIWRRLNVENEHFMGVVVGREGSGKSHSTLSMARAVDPGFTANDVYFDPKHLLEAFDADSYGKGDVIVLDEAGVGMGNRSWYEKAQILTNQTLQTVRDDNMGVFFTLPRLEELDSQTRGRLHALIEMTELEKEEGYALAKWKNVSLTRDGRGNEYKKYPRMRGPDGAPRRVERIKIGPPPQALAEAYEELKGVFKQELYEDAIAAYDDEPDDDRDPKDVADEIIDEGVSQYVSEHGGNGRRYVDQELIRAEFGLSHRDSKAAKKLVERTTDLSSQNTQTP